MLSNFDYFVFRCKEPLLENETVWRQQLCLTLQMRQTTRVVRGLVRFAVHARGTQSARCIPTVQDVATLTDQATDVFDGKTKDLRHHLNTFSSHEKQLARTYPIEQLTNPAAAPHTSLRMTLMYGQHD